MILALGCSRGPEIRGVYRAGENAVIAGEATAPVKVWGPDGTTERLPSPAPGGNSFVGAAGPLWRVDHDVPAPARAPVVAARMVELAGFRMAEVLGTRPTGALDAARAGGVYVRSAIKMRQEHGPPIYLLAATGDEVGAGRWGGPPDVRQGENCKAAVGTMDSKGERLLSAIKLDEATAICAVPTLLFPVDIDADGDLDLLAHGQNGAAGFRAWFQLEADGTLVPGPHEVWKQIP